MTEKQDIWFTAIESDNVNQLQELQLFKTYDSAQSINRRYQGWCAIHYASFYGSLKCLKFLVNQEGGMVTINTNFPLREKNDETEFSAGSTFIHIMLQMNHQSQLQDILNSMTPEQIRYLSSVSNKKQQSIMSLAKVIRNDAARILVTQEKVKTNLATNISIQMKPRKQLKEFMLYETELELNDSRVFRFDVRTPKLEQIQSPDYIFTGVKGTENYFGTGVIEFSKAKTLVNFIGKIDSIEGYQIQGVGELKLLGRHPKGGQMTTIKIGQFKNSMLNGIGLLYIPGYASFFGVFNNDKLHGPVSIYYSQGNHVIQIFNQGHPLQITESYNQGTKIKFLNQQCTYGQKITPQYVYEGGIFRNSCHGQGKRVFQNGVIEDGQFLFEEYLDQPNSVNRNVEVSYLLGLSNFDAQSKQVRKPLDYNLFMSQPNNFIVQKQTQIEFQEEHTIDVVVRNDLEYRFTKICQKLKNQRNMQQFFVMNSNLKAVTKYYKPHVEDIRDQLAQVEVIKKVQFDIKQDQTKDASFKYNEQQYKNLSKQLLVDFDYVQNTKFDSSKPSETDIFYDSQTLINDSNEKFCLSIFVNHLLIEISRGKRRLEIQFKFALENFKQDLDFKYLNVYLKLLEIAVSKVENITDSCLNYNKWSAGGSIYLVGLVQGQVKPVFEEAKMDMTKVLPDQIGVKYDMFRFNSNTKIRLIPHVVRFYSQQLKDYELQALIDVINGLADLKEIIIIQSPLPKKHFDRFNEALQLDFPELFMQFKLDFKYNSFNELYKIIVKYNQNETEILQNYKLIEQSVFYCVSKVEQYLTQLTDRSQTDVYYEVEKIIIHFLLDHVASGSNNQANSLQGAFSGQADQSTGVRKLNHEGFSKTFQYICMKVNLVNVSICGLLKKATHFWNLVFFGSEWHNVDMEKVTSIDFRYINFNDEYGEEKNLFRNKNNLDLPKQCKKMEHFYYLKENFYICDSNKKQMTTLKYKQILSLFSPGINTIMCQFYYANQPDIKDFRDEIYAAIARVSKQLNRKLEKCVMNPVENEIIQVTTTLDSDVQGDYEVLTPDFSMFDFVKPKVDKRPIEFNKYARFVFDASVYRHLMSKMTNNQYYALQDIVRQIEYCNSIVNFRIPISKTDLSVVQSIIDFEFPEYFFGSAATESVMNNVIYQIKFKGMSSINPLVMIDMQNKMILWRNKIRNDILAQNLSESSAGDYIQSWLSDNVKNGKGTYAKTAYGAIVERSALPLGKIQAFNYIAQWIGIPCQDPQPPKEDE